jgi:hypothetical protein
MTQYTRDAVESNTRMMRLHERGILSLEECFQNLLDVTFFSKEESWRDGLAVIPISLRREFLEHVRSHLVPVDFMPQVGNLFPINSPEAREAARQERRPRYTKLLQLIEEICSGPTEGNRSCSTTTSGDDTSLQPAR